MLSSVLIIGDIHSRASALSKALADNPGLQIIFIGDTLDGRHYKKNTPEAFKTLEDLATLQLVIDCLKSGARLISGNHDIRLIFGDDVKCPAVKTKARLSNYQLFQEFIKQVKQADTYFEFQSGDKKYQLAHAVPFSAATKTDQVFGQKAKGQRVKWFEQTQTWPENVVKVSGHFHQIIVQPNLVVLDGDNKTENCLPVLRVKDGVHELRTYTN